MENQKEKRYLEDLGDCKTIIVLSKAKERGFTIRSLSIVRRAGQGGGRFQLISKVLRQPWSQW